MQFKYFQQQKIRKHKKKKILVENHALVTIDLTITNHLLRKKSMKFTKFCGETLFVYVQMSISIVGKFMEKI